MNKYESQRKTEWSKLQDQPKIGQVRRFDNMKRRLSIGFAQTRKQRDKDNMLSYARNRNSKGRLVPVFVTLTYPTNEQWNPSDIANYCKKMNQFALRNWGIDLRYFWVAETTSKGVIHYHYTTWIPRTAKLPKPSEPQIINNREYPPAWKYRGKIEGVKKGVYSYLLKYISKGCVIDGLGIQKRITKPNKYKCFKDSSKIVKPRLFGYGGFDPNQREYMTYSMLPKYVRRHFNSVEYGDKVQRVTGGWVLNKKQKVSKIYKYFQYGNELLKTNFSLWVDELNGHTIIGYDYGLNWSSVPPPPTDDIWYPF